MKTKKDQLSSEGVSRRSVLKGAIAVSAAAMGGGMALNLAAPGTAEAMIKTLPRKWDETWDVVIIGTGFAGLAAAAEAAKAGSKVVILEKMPIYGGNSTINGGGYAAWTDKLHLREKLNLGNDSPKQHFDDTLKGGDYYNIPELVQVLVDGAPEALNWMMDEGGLEIRQVVNRAGGHSAYRAHFSKTSWGRDYTEALRKIAEKYGAKMVLNSEVTWIWRKDADQKSPVLGLEIKQGKRVLNMKAQKAVILASGGFSRDVKMRMDHYPKLIADFNCTNHKGATGEMIRYAQAVGADTLQMNFIQLYPFAEPSSGTLDNPAVYPFSAPGRGCIYVNKLGKRFVSELERRDVCAFAQINMGEKMKPTYTVFSAAMVPLIGETQESLDAGLKKGRFTGADTIADLAKKIGIPSETLEKTVNDHNRYLQEGKDAEFNKPISKAMLPLDKGPFYAVAQWPAVHHTMGGLRINKNAQVIDVFGAVIPKFYAAGEVAGGVHGSNRLGTNATADCVVFGRVAGMNAAKEK
ncbi:fumarate reductase flavoprotein subunit [Syntrophus gentianae]|uniref:Fumarate reductase flavoprotein subunit n=1 Tax=Syntrophus gentianae TaxID=43775 RepID=A0A1H7XPP3_9BACT|nr:flavocytochrome c [Syntrophus gentianae]SEM35750.1 fumarate reductase flavoprotein subunit [Syntrophus gentianae]